MDHCVGLELENEEAQALNINSSVQLVIQCAVQMRSVLFFHVYRNK